MKQLFKLCTGFLTGALLISASAAMAQGLDYVPNEVLVKFKDTATEVDKIDALAHAGSGVKEIIHTPAMAQAGARGLVLASSVRPVPQTIEALRQHPSVEYAEPNWIVGHNATSTDTYYTNGSLWGMYGDDLTITPDTTANAFGSQAEEAWAAESTGSKSVYIGVIDEGIQYTHPDLDANIWVNPFDPADGNDNDGNGYIDDVRGWDFVNNDNTIYDGGKRGSLDKHGTHVAGTIGAESDGTGVVGVNWNVTLISGKFLGRRGGTIANAIKAVDYFTDMKTRHGLNIVATNNSWGGGGYSQGLYEAIERANIADILFVAAAGNGGSDGVGDDNDVTPSYPSSYPNSNIIAVASITSTGAKSSFSNYGLTTVDMGAPGSGIYSTLPFNTYGSYSGTSMATPHVTGAAALYAATKLVDTTLDDGIDNPTVSVTAATIKNALLSSAVPTDSLNGKTVTGGRLDAFGALYK